jgi:hypothetical protein
MHKMTIMALVLAAGMGIGGAAEARQTLVVGQNWVMGQDTAMMTPTTGAVTTTFAQERARRQAIQQSMGQRGARVAMRNGRR